MPTPAYTWTAVIIIHTLLAAVSLILGGALLWGRKGHRWHRLGGWVWVLSMAGVAGISFWIRGETGFSWIHGLSVFTLITVATGVMFARQHKVRAHRQNMIALYVGALVITGLFTLMPGRLLGTALWNWLG